MLEIVVSIASGISVVVGDSNVAVVLGAASSSPHAAKSATEPKSRAAATALLDGMISA